MQEGEFCEVEIHLNQAADLDSGKHGNSKARNEVEQGFYCRPEAPRQKAERQNQGGRLAE
jgi:hypothetical protein